MRIVGWGGKERQWEGGQITSEENQSCGVECLCADFIFCTLYMEFQAGCREYITYTRAVILKLIVMKRRLACFFPFSLSLSHSTIDYYF